MSAPEPFATYTRTRIESRDIAEVTRGNIGQIAALIGGQVDYSGGEPVLVAPDSTGRPWRVKVGWHVSLLGTQLVNMNGFNSGGEWATHTPTEPTTQEDGL